MATNSWAARQAAVEGSYFRIEQMVAMRRHIERLVEEGKLPEGTLSNTSASTPAAQRQAALDSMVNIEYRGRKNLPEHAMKFQYQKAEFPIQSKSFVHNFKLGTQVSFGPGRWAGGEASIWDVKAGKDLAQTPSKQATWAEEIRMRKVAKAQYESPLVAGYRLLPQFTPGKAFFWGTILAVWGTSMGALLASKTYGLTKENIPDKIQALGEPFKESIKQRLDPLKETWSATTPSTQGAALKVHETDRKSVV